jgi:uncharacterized membrane protein
MKKFVLYIAVALSSGLFFANIYNSMVNAANWESNVPRSITAARDFFVVANPGTFFQLIDPATEIVILLALIVCWKQSTSIRINLAIAFLFFISSTVLTFTYFYPRNEIMFLSQQLADTETLQLAATEWGRMNWVRSLLMLAGVVCTFLALDKVISHTKKQS